MEVPISLIYFIAENFKVLPFNLSDIGEGIAEVTVKEWFVDFNLQMH